MAEKSKQALSLSIPDVIKVVSYGSIILLSFFVVQTTATDNKNDIVVLQEKDKEHDDKIISLEKREIERRGEFNLLRNDLEDIEAFIAKVEYHLNRLDPAKENE